jgi:AcrR family transcriptional regulator
MAKKKVVNQKPDRRVQRTRQLLREAFTSAVLEKGYEATTVQDILDRANLGRSTFYSHYRDKDELLISGFDHLRQIFEEYDGQLPSGNPERPARAYPPVLLFFQHAADHHKLYKSILGSKQGEEIVQRYLYKMISSRAGQHLKQLMPKGKKPPVPQEIILHYLTSSMIAILTWWLNHDLPYSPEEIYEMYHLLTIPAINAGLGKH